MTIDDASAWHRTIRDAFMPADHLCLDAARWHPLPLRSLEAQHAYLRSRARNACWDDDPGMGFQEAARTAFARLIGATSADVALVPSTGWAEHMVVAALSLPQAGAILTDTGHFDASVLHYDMLAAAGADIRYVPRDATGLDLAAVEQELRGGDVRLIATALVSNATGGDVDLPALVDLAHRYGALVFADVIQTVGGVPLDVRASGVDFVAASGYKWLMGDMGMGFLYVSPEVLPSLRRPVHGFRQMRDFIEPWPPAGARSWALRDDAEGLFGVNSRAVGAAASIATSIDLLQEWGVERLACHRAALLDQVRTGLSTLGYTAITPPGSIAPFIVFDTTDRPDTADRLRHANINAGVSPGRLRIAPANAIGSGDVERVVEALSP